MVAAGVFLVARMYPLMDADIGNIAGQSTALTVVAWTGAITAVFAASIALAQTDIKRILAYSTVSQLGYMLLGIGVGGFAVGMFHLVTHAFFKALLFMGAGSVIHGCHEEQDIRRMGGLRRFMPATFATYAVGMMALSGVPLFFSGFWSKDEILHAAAHWEPSRWPFYLGAAGAFLTAFYMTRQMAYVFWGRYRGDATHQEHAVGHTGHATPHESPRVMTVPLIVLATGTVLLSFVGTPFWPWFHAYLSGHVHELHLSGITAPVLQTMALSIVIVAFGIGSAWWLYGSRPARTAEALDPLERLQPDLFGLLRAKYWVDELYDLTIVRATRASARLAHWLDQFVWDGLVQGAAYLVLGLAWLNRLLDEFVVNLGFDQGCSSLRSGARWLSWWQNGQVQRYLRVIGLALVVAALVLLWGWRP
jgi:NADH-quinone oxidoreductase subunit L